MVEVLLYFDLCSGLAIVTGAGAEAGQLEWLWLAVAQLKCSGLDLEPEPVLPLEVSKE